MRPPSSYHHRPGTNARPLPPCSHLRRIHFDLRDDLRTFTKPTLIVHGRQDILGELAPQETHDALPMSRVVWLNECRHYGWLDQPDAFFGALASFFSETDEAQ